jgi:hypothetical protein
MNSSLAQSIMGGGGSASSIQALSLVQPVQALPLVPPAQQVQTVPIVQTVPPAQQVQPIPVVQPVQPVPTLQTIMGNATPAAPKHNYTNPYNNDLALRQAEINEWSYHNKMDTLFVFQLIFISLMTVALLYILSSQGYMGLGFVMYTMGILAFIMIIVIVNRYIYTRTTRDKRNWNRRRFGSDAGVESPLTRGDNSYQEYIDAIRGTYGSGVALPPAGSSCRC